MCFPVPRSVTPPVLGLQLPAISSLSDAVLRILLRNPKDPAGPVLVHAVRSDSSFNVVWPSAEPSCDPGSSASSPFP